MAPAHALVVDRPVAADEPALPAPAAPAAPTERPPATDRAARPAAVGAPRLAPPPDPAQGPTPAVPWTVRARCRDGEGALTYLFFSDHPAELARARAICARCPVRAECLAEALDRREPWGVWGGELLEQGRIVPLPRPRGRPPKRAPDLASTPEVPLPPWLVADLRGRRQDHEPRSA